MAITQLHPGSAADAGERSNFKLVGSVFGRRSKKLVWFDESGDEPFADEPAKLNTAMPELVRSLLP